MLRSLISWPFGRELAGTERLWLGKQDSLVVVAKLVNDFLSLRILDSRQDSPQKTISPPEASSFLID